MENIYTFIYLFFSTFFIVVQVRLSPFSPYYSPPLHPPQPPALNPSILWLCPCVLYTGSLMTLPFLSPVIPLPSGYCQFVLYFKLTCNIILN